VNAPGRSRGARVSLTALQIVLGLFYAVASALPKLIAHPSAAETFDKLGWGHTGMYIIGALELAGGIALLIPLLAGMLGLFNSFRMMRLPDPAPSAAAEGMAFG